MLRFCVTLCHIWGLFEEIFLNPANQLREADVRKGRLFISYELAQYYEYIKNIFHFDNAFLFIFILWMWHSISPF